ncbi:hypothetical protein HYG87_09085 [Methanobacterium alkalithermotolerans]|uniref:Uncharacterized protein n=1 Tax=Methanobacterium alkalithermotolerans TaxID=2731220 RepID=A0A8T8K5N5_9EURY|nr:hypothetical protein [Methanobacterium alkalithermotolerans]QUH23896.1 hypothetical protein HYG87_09085 [Methanobacterium alkalithermotolerans]RJS49114.1 MAG: hypothetical protein CIT03_05040 [Methanobacterium sp.]
MSDKQAQKAEKELKARMRLFKKLLKDEKEKIKFYDGICGSEILVRLELFLPSDNPDKFVDGIILYMNDSGKIVDAEYYFKELEEGAITRISDEDLKVVQELFQDEFSLEIE